MHAVSQNHRLVGNRWMLIGGIVYLLEWVAIIWTGVLGANVLGGESEAIALDSYAGNVDAVASMTGWFAVVLLGRILVFVALRHALVSSGHGHPLLDLAVPAATVSVVLEIAAYAMATAASTYAETDPAATLLLDQAGIWFNWVLAGGLAVAILCSSYVMLRSGLFPKSLSILGIVSGVPILAAQLLIAPAFTDAVGVLGWSVFLFWIWMLWAGVYLWVKAPRRAAATRHVESEEVPAVS